MKKKPALPKIRRSWVINPRTRVKKSAKKRTKESIKKETEELIEGIYDEKNS